MTTRLAALLALAGSKDPELEAELLKQEAFDEYRAGKRKPEPRHLAKALGKDDDGRRRVFSR
jgi:hypothetical protein